LTVFDLSELVRSMVARRLGDLACEPLDLAWHFRQSGGGQT
jgi:hypothetical protein